MSQSIVCNDDIKWLEQRTPQEITMIVGQMTSLLEAISDTKKDTDAKVAKIQNQGWFKRLWNTITGKNKATKEDIRRNQDKIVGYISQAVAKLFELNLIEMQAIQSLGNRINQVYAQLTEVYNEQLQMKAQIAEIQSIQQETINSLGEIANDLDEKIESIDNFHMLTKEIEQGKYQNRSRIYSMCSVLAQLDKRTINDDRKMDILKVALQRIDIATFKNVSLKDCIMEVLSMSDEEAGTVYLELCNYRDTFPASILVEVIEEYHFLPKLEKMAKKKEVIIDKILEENNIDGSAEFSYSDILESFIENKSNTFLSLNQVPQIQMAEEGTTDSDENSNNNTPGFFGFIANTIKDAVKSGEVAVLLSNSDESSEQKALPDTSPKIDEAEQLYWKGIYHQYEKKHELTKPGLAKQYFQQAAEKGNTASFFYINYYMKSSYERKRFLESEANKGNPEAQYLLAQYYRNQKHDSDRERKRNDQNAKPLLEKAALKGHIPAQYELGRWYARHYTSRMDTVIGSWTYDKYYYDENLEEALKWIRKAADAGFPPAQMRLGYYYTEGQGVQKDLNQAFEWYLKAAMQGYDDATYEIGRRYHKGIGVTQDLNKAIEWYKKSDDYWAKDALKTLGIK